MGAERERGERELTDLGTRVCKEEDEEGEEEVDEEEQEEDEALSLDLGWRRDGERLGKRKAMIFIRSPSASP